MRNPILPVRILLHMIGSSDPEPIEILTIFDRLLWGLAFLGIIPGIYGNTALVDFFPLLGESGWGTLYIFLGILHMWGLTTGHRWARLLCTMSMVMTQVWGSYEILVITHGFSWIYALIGLGIPNLWAHYRIWLQDPRKAV